MTSLVTAELPARCPTCGHSAEGNELRVKQAGGKWWHSSEVIVTECNSGYDMGFGDFDSCGCRDDSHSWLVSEQAIRLPS